MLIDNRFEIIKQFGAGGLGVVYLAADTLDGGRQVIVKQLLALPDEKSYDWIERHFRDEARALVRVQHPGIVKFVAFGKSEDNRPYLAMEFVEGDTLRAALDGDLGVGDLERVAHLIRQLGQAISAANDAGVYHRDLKPENILITRTESGEELVKVIDFGIATVKDRLDEKTKATAIAGSVHYMSPEQIDGRPGAATDIYALGVIAYEMITGRRPFSPDRTPVASTMLQLKEMQREGVRVRPKDLRPSLPDAAQVSILKALRYEAKGRHARAEEFGNELAKALLADETVDTEAGETLEMATVVFMDIVGYSKLAMDLQTRYLRELQTAVRAAPTFTRANAGGKVISLPTGDGMALAFFGDLMAGVRCAVEVARCLKEVPHIALRTGVNSGPVYRVDDINANRNVAGGGINMAQRVMDCGDAGHILVSGTVADTLLQLSEWQNHVKDLGTHAVKHGVALHVFNLHTDEVGNPDVPAKLRTTIAAAPESVPRPDAPTLVERSRTLPESEALAAAAAPTGRRIPLLAFAGLLVAVAAAAIAYAVWPDSPKPVPPVADVPRTGFTYSFLLGRCKDGRAVGDLRAIAGSEAALFASGEGLRVRLTPETDGYLYVINEAPQKAGSGLPRYRALFPDPDINGGEAIVRGSQVFEYPQEFLLCFEGTAGTETIYFVFSQSKVSEFEAVRGTFNTKDEGLISSEPDVRAIRSFLEAHTVSANETVRGAQGSKETTVRTAGSTLVQQVLLEHK